MAIQINDLPLLKDLTPEQLKELFGAGKARLQMEALEDRLVQAGFSATALFGSTGSLYSLPSVYNQVTPAPPPVVAAAYTEVAKSPTAAADLYTQLAPAPLGADAYGDVVSSDAGKSRDYGSLIIAQGNSNLATTGIDKADAGYQAIQAKVNQLGDWIGSYLSGEEGTVRATADGVGRHIHFTNASIYWHPDVGAHEVHGATRDKLASMGWEGFGYATSDQLGPDRFTGETTRQDFYHPAHPDSPGTIVSSKMGTYAIYGAIRAQWAMTNGRPGQIPGLVPTSDEYDVDAVLFQGRAQNFHHISSGQNETITWNRENGLTYHQVTGVQSVQSGLAAGWVGEATAVDQKSRIDYSQLLSPNAGWDTVVTPVEEKNRIDYSELLSPAPGGYSDITPVEQKNPWIDYSNLLAPTKFQPATGEPALEGPAQGDTGLQTRTFDPALGYDPVKIQEGKNAVKARVDQLRGILGKPLAGNENPRMAADNYGVLQDFENGTVIWSPETGARFMNRAIRDKWAEVGGSAYIGYAMEDQAFLPGSESNGAVFCDFYSRARGAKNLTTIVSFKQEETTYTHWIFAEIRNSWAFHKLGVPFSDRANFGGGSAQLFRGRDGGPIAVIAWTPQTGANPIYGQVAGAWVKGVEQGGLYGCFPIDKGYQNPLHGHFKNVFTGAQFALVSDTVNDTVHFVGGAIYDAWISWPYFGDPRTDEADTDDGAFRFMNFSYNRGDGTETKKAIYYEKATGKVFVDNGDGHLLHFLNWEHFRPGKTGTTSSPLIAGAPGFDLLTAYQQSTLKTQTGAIYGQLLNPYAGAAYESTGKAQNVSAYGSLVDLNATYEVAPTSNTNWNIWGPLSNVSSGTKADVPGNDIALSPDMLLPPETSTGWVGEATLVEQKSRIDYSQLVSPGATEYAEMTPAERLSPAAGGYSDIVPVDQKGNPIDYSELVSPAPVISIVLPQFLPYKEFEDTTTAAADGSLQVRTFKSPEELAAYQAKGRLAIEAKVRELGASLGTPPEGSKPTKDGIGRYQSFPNGKYIIWSEGTGAHLVEGLIGEEFIKRNGIATLGYPTSDAQPLAAWPGAYHQNFVRLGTAKFSSIVWTQDTGAQTIQSGPMWFKWAELGRGLIPLGPEYNQNGGRAQDFLSRNAGGFKQFSTIVSSEQSGTHILSGPILSAWDRAGRPGLPTTDQVEFAVAGQSVTHKIVHFKARRLDGTMDYFAIGDSGKGTYFVGGYVYLGWNSSGAEVFGIPITPERSFVSGDRTFYASTFVNRDGSVRTIYWTPTREPQFGIAALAEIQSDDASHYYVNYGDGKGVMVFNFTPKAGPSGFEPVAPRTGTTSSGLSVGPAAGPAFDPSTVYQQSTTNTQAGSIYGNLLNPYAGAAYETTGKAQNVSAYDNLLDLSHYAVVPNHDVWIGLGDLVSYAPATAAAETGLAELSGYNLTQEVVAYADAATNLSPYAVLAKSGWDLSATATEVGSLTSPIASYFNFPRLNSNPGAAKTIYLDFWGGSVDQDFRYKDPRPGGFTGEQHVNLRNWNVPQFNLDGKLGFSAAEKAAIQEIWQRVAEDFAPFNVNVTTDWGGAMNDRNMLRIVLGGSLSADAVVADTADRHGLSLLDSMKQGGPNLAFVFTDSIKGLGGNLATMAANVAAREAGHAFGLRYHTEGSVPPQSKIMGANIGGYLSRWAEGSVPKESAISPNAWEWQEDLKTLTGALGLRDDDHGDDGGFTNLGNLDATGSLQGKGVIGIPLVLRTAETGEEEWIVLSANGPVKTPRPDPNPRDVDGFSFQTDGGKIQFAAKGIGAGQNLEVRVEVWSGSTQVGKSRLFIETGDLNAALTLTLPAGTYTIKVVGGAGFKYGNLGEYTLSVTKAPRFTIEDLQPLNAFGGKDASTKGFAALTENANLFDLTAAYQSTAATTWENGAPFSSLTSSDPVQWVDSYLAQAEMADYEHVFQEEREAIEGNAFPFVPPDPFYPLQWGSSKGVSDADLAAIVETPIDPDIGLWEEYAPGLEIPPVLESAGLSYAAWDVESQWGGSPLLWESVEAMVEDDGSSDATWDESSQWGGSPLLWDSVDAAVAESPSEAGFEEVQAQQDVVDQPVADEPQALQDAVAQPEAAGQQADDMQALAAQLVGEHGLGAYHPEWTQDNWLNRGERWILNQSNQWYFITPDGGLFSYNGSEADSALVGTLDATYWENLDKLLNPAAQSAVAEETVAGPEEVAASQADVAVLAAQLVGDHGLGAYHPEWTQDNWLGRGERWILSNANEWYFITPDGGLYRYNGSEADSALVGTLDQSYWENLDKLLGTSA